jgi:pimeloyl-ACP methyl ester carboxylesterase
MKRTSRAIAAATAFLAVAVSSPTNVAAHGVARPAAKTSLSADRPTIVLVHGAFADSSSWDGVTQRLIKDGYEVVAAANPLRDLDGDAAAVRSVLRNVEGPVVLVGHSYGGAVITNAARGNDAIQALVYVAGFAPDEGESAGELAALYPGSTLGSTLVEAPRAGDVDLTIKRELFRRQFAADVKAAKARLMAVSQRPITTAALTDHSGTPAWETAPSYFLIPGRDKNIPPAAQEFMARRAAATVVRLPKASHAVPVSRPIVTATLIERAAEAAD